MRKVVTVGPILFSVGLNLYNKINLVDAPCPVCGVGLQGLKNKENQCPRYETKALCLLFIVPVRFFFYVLAQHSNTCRYRREVP